MDELLYKAVTDDRPARLAALLKNGADPNAWIEDYSRVDSKSLLHICCEKGKIRCAKILLDYGAEIDVQASWGQTPLMLCILTEYLDVAELLMSHSSEIVDSKDTSGRSPLHIAINNDSVDSVRLLVKYNADVNIVNNNGVTPLMDICASKDSENAETIVEILMRSGADVSIKDFKSKRTVLQLAVLSRKTEIVRPLLQAGADVNTVDSAGRTPLTTLMLGYLGNYATTGEIPTHVLLVVEMLITAGADLNLCSHESSNPLVMAAGCRCTPLVRLLLQRGATQSNKFFAGVTPLLVAVNKKDIPTAMELLNWKCDIYTKGRFMRRNYDFYRDAFELAVENGCTEMVCLLAESGYNISTCDYLVNWSIDPPASLKNSPEVLEYLRLNAVLVPTLFRSCVMCVRGCVSRHGDIAKLAATLPLPKILKDSVALKDVFT